MSIVIPLPSCPCFCFWLAVDYLRTRVSEGCCPSKCGCGHWRANPGCCPVLPGGQEQPYPLHKAASSLGVKSPERQTYLLHTVFWWAEEKATHVKTENKTCGTRHLKILLWLLCLDNSMFHLFYSCQQPCAGSTSQAAVIPGSLQICL